MLCVVIVIVIVVVIVTVFIVIVVIDMVNGTIVMLIGAVFCYLVIVLDAVMLFACRS